MYFNFYIKLGLVRHIWFLEALLYPKKQICFSKNRLRIIKSCCYSTQMAKLFLSPLVITGSDVEVLSIFYY